MTPSKTCLAAVLALAAPALAQKDEFRREGTPEQRVAKDALEGKAPPPLQVRDWMNTDGKSLALADLRGKVVLLDFWGVW
jgi:hypothetical protein